MEIHQAAENGEETVQRINLQDYVLEDVKLRYRFDGDLLIPLQKGDYIVYFPNEHNNEIPVRSGDKLTIGMIFYHLDELDLADYDLTVHFHRSFTQGWSFIAFMVTVGLWVIASVMHGTSVYLFRNERKQMELRRSGISYMSELYEAIYVINLPTGEVAPVSPGDYLEELREKYTGAKEMLYNAVLTDADEQYLDAALAFVDTDTMAERLKGRKSMVYEFVSKVYGWCRFRLFAMEAGEDRPVENGIATGSFSSGDRTLAYRVSGFTVRQGGAVRGYLIDIRDATEEKKNLELLTDYNDRLNREVTEKTRDIETIQEKLVLSMADMVENRDSNTGGHVRRTSDIVGILVREIMKDRLFPLDESLARDIIRTAPMHDLGKISINPSILNKPTRLTPEEYTVMKTHSTISGQMGKILLEGVEEDSLVQTAYRLARHHHERWDGKGYPDGLVGETIPVEARIMAVADVYDALVSKRVYKEPMSFEQAARIMCEGMGTQFDPNMRIVFQCCRPELERYYSAIQ